MDFVIYMFDIKNEIEIDHNKFISKFWWFKSINCLFMLPLKIRLMQAQMLYKFDSGQD